MTPEGKIKEQVKALLKKHKVFYFMPVSNGFGKHGIPDFICSHNGHFLGLETKAEGKKPTALQVKCMKEIEDAGGKCFVVDSQKMIEEVEKWLQNTNTA
jgi:hypothetical protein